MPLLLFFYNLGVLYKVEPYGLCFATTPYL
jgi:hypothetical protein